MDILRSKIGRMFAALSGSAAAASPCTASTTWDQWSKRRMRLDPGLTSSQKREFVTLTSSPEGAPDIDASTLTRILQPYRRSNPSAAH